MRRIVTVGGIVVTAMLAGSIAAAAEPRAGGVPLTAPAGCVAPADPGAQAGRRPQDRRRWCPPYPNRPGTSSGPAGRANPDADPLPAFRLVRRYPGRSAGSPRAPAAQAHRGPALPAVPVPPPAAGAYPLPAVPVPPAAPAAVPGAPAAGPTGRARAACSRGSRPCPSRLPRCPAGRAPAVPAAPAVPVPAVPAVARPGSGGLPLPAPVRLRRRPSRQALRIPPRPRSSSRRRSRRRRRSGGARPSRRAACSSTRRPGCARGAVGLLDLHQGYGGHR